MKANICLLFPITDDDVVAWAISQNDGRPIVKELAAISRVIHDLRMEGVKICSGYDGVWLWNGEDNSWELTKNHIRSRAMSMITLLRAMELSYDGQGEQIGVNL